MLQNGHSSLAEMPKMVKEAVLEKPCNQIYTQVVSNTPGRLRLRIAQPHRQVRYMQRLVSSLEAHPNVYQVKSNIHHGSILIHHDGGDNSLENILSTLWDLGIIFKDITEGKSEAATEVSNAVVDLNKRVQRATNNFVDLRFLFPLTLGVLSIRQLIIKGLQFEIIPWYVLAWYAFDSFLKLHALSVKPSNSE